MNKTTVKEEAQKMVIGSLTDSVEFSIEFYKEELKKEKAKDNRYMVAHCNEMIKAYTIISFMLKHFKF